MDQRILKTKAALKAAFYTLKKEKPVEKISVKELCELAEINKSTFYIHYTDIYDLSRQLARDSVQEIIRSIPQDEEYTFSNPELFTKQLVVAFQKSFEELDFIFDSNSAYFGTVLDEELKNVIFKKYPALKDNSDFNVILTYCIHGAYNAQLRNTDVPLERLVAILTAILQSLQPLFTEK